MSSNRKTVTFLGASTGIGLSTLKHTLAAGHRCIAICRTPSKLTAIFPPETNPNLEVVQGNAHDVTVVSQCLLASKGKLVDEIISTIGGAFIFSRLTLDDPHVCEKGINTMLEALAELRKGGATGNPHIVVLSTTGMSRFGRDLPILMMPLYHILMHVPHADKLIMEDRLIESGEAFTIVRASLLVDGESSKKIRVGIEDPKNGRESTAIGYTISREDCGKWVADSLVLQMNKNYANKIVVVTY